MRYFYRDGLLRVGLFPPQESVFQIWNLLLPWRGLFLLQDQSLGRYGRAPLENMRCIIFGFWGERWFVERAGKIIVAILWEKVSCIANSITNWMDIVMPISYAKIPQKGLEGVVNMAQRYLCKTIAPSRRHEEMFKLVAGSFMRFRCALVIYWERSEFSKARVKDENLVYQHSW